jgi:dihydrodipicolinate synthase/N-acetylneuraminate lyase
MVEKDALRYQFLLMTVGEFPLLEDDERHKLEAEVLEAVGAALAPFRVRGVDPANTRLRVELAKDFPL